LGSVVFRFLAAAGRGRPALRVNIRVDSCSSVVDSGIHQIETGSPANFNMNIPEMEQRPAVIMEDVTDSPTVFQTNLRHKRRSQLLLAALFLSTFAAAGQSSKDQVVDLSQVPQLHETPERRDARMRWFRDAKFGMFIHWGPCTVGDREIGWGRHANRPWDINQNGPREVTILRSDTDSAAVKD
jgi:hypothetical protein